ncbi:MAG: transporter substrate-binding domain-containing protein [Clostridia bacterium]|nr:transporter substrate-binding domain-containing protein [Clostridia bacterium]
MKKIITLIMTAIMALVSVFAFTACNSSTGSANTLYVYTNAGFAPYEYINEKGEVVGVDIDVMKEVGEVLGYNVVINDIEFNQILVEVAKNKNAVGAAGMTKKPDRDDVALASIPYATSVQYAIVPKGTFGAEDLVDGKLPVSALSALTKKAIGVQEGTTGNFLIEDAIVDGGDLGTSFQCMTYTNAIVASQDIGTTLGAVVIDKLPAKSICEANSALECVELVADIEEYVIYFNKEASELVEKVNKVLSKMIEGGVIDYYTLKHSGGIL